MYVRAPIILDAGNLVTNYLRIQSQLKSMAIHGSMFLLMHVKYGERCQAVFVEHRDKEQLKAQLMAKEALFVNGLLMSQHHFGHLQRLLKMPNFSSQMLFHHLHFLCLFYVAALVLLKMLTPHSPTKISNIIYFATETSLTFYTLPKLPICS